MLESISSYTIFHALDNQRLESEAKENRSLSLFSKITKGVGASFLVSPKFIFIFRACILVQEYYRSILQNSPLFVCIIGPVVEEYLFRKIIQGQFFSNVQKWAESSNFQYKNTRLFKWLISPSGRIMMANILFALSHFSEDYTTSRIVSILLFPMESILYQTTGNILAPIASHMMHNFLATQIFL